MQDRLPVDILHYSGPTAREDAENDERTRWITILSLLIESMQTSLGRLLVNRPGHFRLLGSGRRASTLRSRVREVRKDIHRLAPGCIQSDLSIANRACDRISSSLVVRPVHQRSFQRLSPFLRGSRGSFMRKEGILSHSVSIAQGYGASFTRDKKNPGIFCGLDGSGGSVRLGHL